MFTSEDILEELAECGGAGRMDARVFLRGDAGGDGVAGDKAVHAFHVTSARWDTTRVRKVKAPDQCVRCTRRTAGGYKRCAVCRTYARRHEARRRRRRA